MHMSGTYRTDDTLFTYVKIRTSSYLGIETIKDWFRNHPLRMYRIIDDAYMDSIHADLKQRDEWYSDTCVFTVVMNPWRRVRLMWLDEIKNMTTNADFESYVDRRLMGDLPGWDLWYDPNMPQIDWCQYQLEDGSIKKADHIFRIENLKEEFLPIQSYFNTSDPLSDQWLDQVPEYREFYSDRLKNRVGDVFKADVDAFGYDF